MGDVVKMPHRERRVVWCSAGMRWFGQLTAEALGYELMVGGYIGECDVCHIIGMYDAPTYATTLKMTEGAKRRIIHWCGTDVLLLQDASILPKATHVADSQGLVDELFAKGVDATLLMFPTRTRHKVYPLPKEPMVAAYLGSNPATYGNDMFAMLAQCFPDVKFHGFSFGQYNEDAMIDLVKKSSGIVRLTRHDGSGATAREWMEAGRFAITTNGIKHATHVRPDDLPQVERALRACLARTTPDEEAAAYWREQNSFERFMREVDSLA